MKRKVSIYKIASEAGVSTTTISRYFKKDIKLAKATIKKIEEVCAKYNYRPSPIASAITTKKTKTIVFVCTNIKDNTRLVDLINSVSERISYHGYGIYLYSTDFNIEKQNAMLRLIDGRLIDGVVIGGHSVVELGKSKLIYDELCKRDIPVVFTEKYIDDMDAPLVAMDGFRGGQIAAKYLLDNGHRNIGIISHGIKDINSTSVDDRTNGFLNLLDRNNIDVSFSLKMNVITGQDKINIEEYLIENKDIILKQKATAIFCASDIWALYLMKFLRLNSFKVPADVSIVGFGNIEAGKFSNPMLTTINNDLYSVGSLAVDNLINKLEKGRFIKKKITIEPKLIIRETVTKI